jgi:hypothetical protein
MWMKHRATGAGGDREVLGSDRVDAEGPCGIHLTAVDSRECGAVHDRFGRERRDGTHDRVMVTDVEVGMPERVHLVMRPEAMEEGASQAAARTRNDQSHGFLSRGAVTTGPGWAALSQSRWSWYHLTVRSSPSSKGTSGA